MRATIRLETWALTALTTAAALASCAKAEDSGLVDRGNGEGGEDGEGKGGSGGSSTTGGSAGKGGSSAAGGSAGKAGASATGGSAGKGGSSTTTGGTTTTTYGCIDDNPGGAAGAGGAEGGAAGDTGTAGMGTAAGAGGAGADGGVVFFDDFEDGNADGWVTTMGDWSIATDGSEVYQQTVNSNNTLRIAAIPGACWADQIVESRIKVVSFNGSSTSSVAALFARYVDPETHYLVGLSSGNNGRLAIQKRANGTSAEVLAQVSDVIDEGVWYVLRLEVVGSSLKAYVDGALQLEATDGDITSGGVAVGTTHAHAQYDDLKVTLP